MEDAQILDLYLQRDEQAITETDHAYGAYCRSISNGILWDRRDTEEVVADTWLQTWNSIPPQRPRLLKQFLGKITRNLALSRWRSMTAQKRGNGQVELALEELSECIPAACDSESYVNLKMLEAAIDRFLQVQPQRERIVFLRRYFYLESVAAITQRYDLSSANVLQILSRTRRKLKKHLQKEGFDL